MARVYSVKHARKEFTAGDGVKVKKGDPYYWWKFRYGPRRTSTTFPKASQLTQSAYRSQVLDLIESASSIDNPSDLDNLISELENLQEEQQNNLDNMPEHLQESSSSGQMLQERIDALDNAVSELQSVDFDEADEDTIREEVLEEYDEDEHKEKAEEIEEAVQERLQEKLEEIQGEIQSAIEGIDV